MWYVGAKSASVLADHGWRRQDRCAPRGFTLMELMLVVAIVAVLAAMAIPTFGGSIARHRVVAAGNRIATDLYFASQTARQQAAPRGVNFDSSTKSYSMRGIADADNPAQAYSVNLSIEPYLISYLSADFGGASNVLFDGFGAAGSAGQVRISSGSFQIAVTLAADGSPPTIAGP